MNQREVNEIIRKHELWLYGEKDGEQANFTGEKLQKICFENANLETAIFDEAELQNINFYKTDLASTSFQGAHIENVNFSRTDLKRATFKEAHIENTFFQGAWLFEANFSKAKLIGTDFQNAFLKCSWFNETQFNKTFFGGANLQDAYFDEKENIRQGLVLNEPMIGYKKCQYGLICKIEVPVGAIVFSISNHKCRTNICKVLSIVDQNGKPKSKARSTFEYSFVYEVGKTIVCPDFNLMYNVECAEGIHFFRTEEEARNY